MCEPVPATAAAPMAGEAAEGFKSIAAELVGTRDRDNLFPAMSSLFMPATTPSVIAGKNILYTSTFNSIQAIAITIYTLQVYFSMSCLFVCMYYVCI